MTDARYFAATAHMGQKYGDAPYTDHLEAVVRVLADFGYGGAYADAGWLHDCCEDTGVSRVEIEAKFGEFVANLVWAVTGHGVNRKARNEDAYAKMAQFPDAVPLKLADRIANSEASRASNPRLFRRYKAEYARFKQALEPYSRGNPMWERLDLVLL